MVPPVSGKWPKDERPSGWSVGVTSFHVAVVQEGVAFRLACFGLFLRSLMSLLQLTGSTGPGAAAWLDHVGERWAATFNSQLCPGQLLASLTARVV